MISSNEANSLASSLAPWLPSPATASDIIRAQEEIDLISQELQAQIGSARASADKHTGSDSVVEAVKSANDLDKYEDMLLSAIIDPSQLSRVVSHSAAHDKQRRSGLPARMSAFNHISSTRFARWYRSRCCSLTRTILASSHRSPWLACCFTALRCATRSFYTTRTSQH